MDTIFSLIGGTYKLLIDVPVFGIGIAVGAFGYRYAAIHYPSILTKLTALAATAAGKVEAEVASAASSTTTEK